MSEQRRPVSFTPEATLGPFYPGVFVDSMPQDLSAVAPLLAHRPRGEPVALVARFLDALGDPVPSLIVEFWQANADGRYRHPQDRSPRPLDPQFDGFARLRTSDDGTLCFQTIKPGPHPVREGSAVMRAPHLRLTIFASGIDRLTTQIFFEDEPLTASDPVLAGISDPDVRERLIARRRTPQAIPGQSVVIEYELDFIMRGERETPFFDDWDQ